MPNIYLIKILILTGLSFTTAFLLTPMLTHYLYKYKMGKAIRNTGATPVFSAPHEHKAGTPTMGGLLIWLTAAGVTLFFNLSREQTWLPLFTLVSAGVLGMIDDMLNIRGFVKGLSAKLKFLFQFLVLPVQFQIPGN